jgi:hypothetical protein
MGQLPLLNANCTLDAAAAAAAAAASDSGTVTSMIHSCHQLKWLLCC